jgi:hypothetical protein
VTFYALLHANKTDLAEAMVVAAMLSAGNDKLLENLKQLYIILTKRTNAKQSLSF